MTIKLRTGQVAEMAGVNIQTLRYYERRGLVPRPARSHGGHRLYPPQTVDRIRTIKLAQRLGFKLAEVLYLLDPDGGHRQLGFARQVADKLSQTEQQISELQEIRSLLLSVTAAGCTGFTDCSCTARPLLHTHLGE